MPYVPRPPDTIKCAHCKKPFERRHASRKYCSNSCNVLASYERTGYRGEPRATRADLERTVAQLMALVNVKPTLVATGKPAAKAQTKKPAAKAAVKPAPKTPPTAAPTKKPAAKAAVKPAPKTPKSTKPTTKPAKKVAQPAAKAVTPPKPTKKAAKRPVKKPVSSGRVIRL